ncbi:MAG: cyclic nucleotide-binding domain-containing protein [Desulfobacterales bacterium]|nr:cyclic nucleotide-binding domain-containing protein [Desulfobacterales bacterium]
MKSDIALSGALNFLNLGDLLQLFGSNGSTGVLRITSPYAPEPGVVHLLKGNPVNAFTGDETGLKALYALFGWVEGEFEFTPKEVPTEKAIEKGRMELILDGLRMLDDGEIQLIGPSERPDASQRDAPSAGGGPLIRGPLIDYMYVVDEEEFSAGQEIVKENSHGNWIWVVVQGLVQVRKETDRGPLELIRVAEGCFIGSMATFTVNGNVRSATSVALEDVSLGVLDTQRLFTDFSALSPTLRSLLLSLDKRLREVSDRILDIHKRAYSLDEYVKDREATIRQGNPEERLFRITEGDATVVRYTDDGHVPLAKLKKGDFFGSVPFFDIGQEPAAASVFASETMQFETVDIGPLQQEYDNLPATFKKLIEHTATCISVTSMVAADYHKESLKEKG